MRSARIDNLEIGTDDDIINRISILYGACRDSIRAASMNDQIQCISLMSHAMCDRTVIAQLMMFDLVGAMARRASKSVLF